MTTTNKFETGASTHAVNDLILFTDNTRELAEARDEIYKQYIKPAKLIRPYESMIQHFVKVLQPKAAHVYDRTFNYDEESTKHITKMSKEQSLEFGILYANDFNNWKIDNGYNSTPMNNNHLELKKEAAECMRIMKDKQLSEYTRLKAKRRLKEIGDILNPPTEN